MLKGGRERGRAVARTSFAREQAPGGERNFEERIFYIIFAVELS